MAFVLSRPSSPAPREYHTQIGPEEDHVNPPHVNLTPGSSHLNPSSSNDNDMGKERPRLEILLDSECLYLKGTGIDVEPSRLSGNVALYLTEATSIKEITLSFRGKARLPVPATDP